LLFIVDPRNLNGSETLGQQYDGLISLGKKVGAAARMAGTRSPLRVLCGKSNAAKMAAQ